MRLNPELVEVIDTDDELHRTICALVCAHGAGNPAAVVWDGNCNPAIRQQSGIVVTQSSYGQRAYSVLVKYDNDSYKVRMLRHTKTVKSDYFAP